MTTQKIDIQQEKKEAQQLTFQDFAIEQSFDQGNGFFKDVWLWKINIKFEKKMKGGNKLKIAENWN